MFPSRECKGTGNWTFPCWHGASLMTSVEIGVGEHWRAGVLGCKGGLGKGAFTVPGVGSGADGG